MVPRSISHSPDAFLSPLRSASARHYDIGLAESCGACPDCKKKRCTCLADMDAEREEYAPLVLAVSKIIAERPDWRLHAQICGWAGPNADPEMVAEKLLKRWGKS